MDSGSELLEPTGKFEGVSLAGFPMPKPCKALSEAATYRGRKSHPWRHRQTFRCRGQEIYPGLFVVAGTSKRRRAWKVRIIQGHQQNTAIRSKQDWADGNRCPYGTEFSRLGLSKKPADVFTVVSYRLDTTKSTIRGLHLPSLAMEEGNLHKGCSAPLLSSKDVEIRSSATPIVSAEEATRIA